MNIGKLVRKLEEIEAHTSNEGAEMINSLIQELIELDLRFEKGFKKHLKENKDEFLETLLQDGIDSGQIGEA